LIRIRYGNAHWSARSFDIWMFKWPDLIWSFPHLPPGAKRAVCPREPWKGVGTTLAMKVRGRFTRQEYTQRLAHRAMGWFTRVRLAALAAFPEVPFNALFSVLARIADGPWARVTRLELRQSPYDYRKRWFGFGSCP